MSDIVLGYEIGTGGVVKIPLRHTAVTGQTQESGKTTTLEGIITRSGLRAVAFITKRGEKSFRLKTTIAPYFRQPVISPETPLWKWVGSILEAAINETMGKEERAAIIQASDEILEIRSSTNKVTGNEKRRTHSTGKKVSTLEQVAQNIKLMLDTSAAGGFKRACICLDAYFEIVTPQIRKLGSSKELKLAPGINVMDLEALTDEMQSLVIRSVIETVYREKNKTVVIVPEAAKFIPNRRGSPVRFAAEMFIRQGLGIGNVLMIDSQDLANVATEVLKSVGVWILGKQNEINEVKRVVAYIPSSPKIPTEAVMQLGRGEFFAVFSGEVRKVYVQPAGMDDVHAQAIARGEIEAESWKQIVRKLDQEEKTGWNATFPAPMDGKTKTGWDAVGDVFKSSPQGDAAEAPEPEAGSDAVFKSTAADAAPPSDKTVVMTQSQYDRLMDSVFNLQETVNRLEKENTFLRGDVQRQVSGPPEIASNGGGDLEWLIRTIKERAPKVLEILAQKPTIEITLERPRVDWDANSIKGRLAQLVAQKFFAQPKKQADVLREFKRRGWLDAKTGNAVVIRPMAEITELGFLTIEAEGYQEVAGMEVLLHEAK